jgi:hypothetical protein
MPENTAPEAFSTYAEFAAALERRPADISPLSWLSGLSKRRSAYSRWMLQWVREQRHEVTDA